MFGKFKESVYSKLNEYNKNNDEESFKKLFVNYFKMISESENLKNLQKIYTEVGDFKSTDTEEINDFINEVFSRVDFTVLHNPTIDFNNLAEDLAIDFKDSYKSKTNESLDNVFKHTINKKTTGRLLERKLLRTYINESAKTKINPEDILIYSEIAKQKISKKLQSLKEDEQKLALKFLTEDKEVIYDKLISECSESIDGKMLIEGIEPDLVNMLSETKKRLGQMKESNPTLENILKVFELSKNLK